MNKDWAAIADKRSQQNRVLSKKVVQLEQELADCREKLRTSSSAIPAEPLSSEQNVHQELLLSLLEEIAAAHECTQHQQMLIDLSQQLEASQERIAQLERECALRQEQYNEQTYQLAVAQAQIQTLVRRHQANTHTFAPAKEAIAPLAKVTTTPTRIQPWSERFEDSLHHPDSRRDSLRSHDHSVSPAHPEKLKIAVGIAQTSEVPSTDALAKSSWPSYRLQTSKSRRTTTIELPEFLHRS